MNNKIPEDFKAFPSISGFIDLVGPYYFGGQDGNTLRYGFLATDNHRNTNGVVHGGALMTFADTAMGSSVYRTVKGPCATISMNCEFIAGANPGAWIEATVVITKVTRTLAFVRAELVSEDTVVLNTSGIWKIFSPKSVSHSKESF